MKQIAKKNVFIAILAGGKGERLWPKSRCCVPKQNLKFFGKRAIIQDTLSRARKIGPKTIFIITCKENFRHVKKQFKKYGNENIIVEPIGRNTAPAVGLAALLAFRKSEDAILAVMPSDHFIRGSKSFFRTIETAINEAGRKDAILTIGIKPVSPESGYGYIGIDAGSSKVSPKKSYNVVKFIEKPTFARAKKLLSDGSFFWNSGIFVFKARFLLSTLKRHMPFLYRGLTALPDIRHKGRFDAGLKKLYKAIKSESLDYAIMEKSSGIRMIPSSFIWNDIGSFNSIAHLLKKDANGNIIAGKHAGVDTKDCFIFSDINCLVGTIGIKGITVVVTPDAVLVCDNKKAGDIKKLLVKIKKRKKFLKFL